jgi:hypothetical protein
MLLESVDVSLDVSIGVSIDGVKLSRSSTGTAQSSGKF